MSLKAIVLSLAAVAAMPVFAQSEAAAGAVGTGAGATTVIPAAIGGVSTAAIGFGVVAVTVVGTSAKSSTGTGTN